MPLICRDFIFFHGKIVSANQRGGENVCGKTLAATVLWPKYPGPSLLPVQVNRGEEPKAISGVNGPQKCLSKQRLGHGLDSLGDAA